MPPWIRASVRLLYESFSPTYFPTIAIVTSCFGSFIFLTMSFQSASSLFGVQIEFLADQMVESFSMEQGDLIYRLYIYSINDRIPVKVAVNGYFLLCLGVRPVCPA